MSLSLEREFQLQAACNRAAHLSREELQQALRYAWRVWLMERQTSEELLRSSLQLEVSIGGPLLPNTLRSAAG